MKTRIGMVIQNIISYLLLFIFLTCIAGCNGESMHPDDNTSTLRIPYDNQTDIATLTEQEFFNDVKAFIYPSRVRGSMSVTWDIEYIQSAGLAQVVRYNNGRYYSVDRFTDGRYLFLLYETNEDQSYIIDGFFCSILVDKALFDSITKGMKREEIVKNDPSSFIDGRRSFHRFSDKSVLEIVYIVEEGEYVVSDFYYLDDERFSISVLDYLLQQDLDKVLEE